MFPEEAFRFLPEIVVGVYFGLVVDFLAEVLDDQRIDERSPHLPQNFEFFERAFHSPLVADPEAIDEHVREGVRQGVSNLDELVDEAEIPDKLGVVQISVEITLNQRSYMIMHPEESIRLEVLSKLDGLDGVRIL